MELKIGCLVRSLRGHDKGQLHFVMDKAEDGSVLLIDGRSRRYECPKRKNIRHVEPVLETVPGVSEQLARGETVKASDIRKILAAFAASDQD